MSGVELAVFGGSVITVDSAKPTGSIEPGKLADLVILNRDLLNRGAGAIGEARVDSTLVEGALVYDASPVSR